MTTKKADQKPVEETAPPVAPPDAGVSELATLVADQAKEITALRGEVAALREGAVLGVVEETTEPEPVVIVSVRFLTPNIHGGIEHAPGDVIEVPDRRARIWGEAGVAELVEG